MPLPDDDDIQFSTLERSFRDLGWAVLDCRRSGGDHEPLYQAMRAVRDEMKRRFPERWGKVSARLLARVESLRKDGAQNITRPVVVNRHHFRGQNGKPDHTLLPKPYLYIGRGTALGNPFKVDDHGERALTLYRTHLWDKITARDPETLEALAKIKWDTYLVCSCAPRPCHGDVVVTCWDWLQRQPWWSPDEHV